MNKPMNKEHKERILLAMLPFNDPQIPPLGLANLKSFLTKENYRVKAVDANTEITFRELFDRYFEIIRTAIPEEKQGNFYSMRLDIMQNQFMAYLNYRKRLDEDAPTVMTGLGAEEESGYIELVKMLIKKTFYIEPGGDLIKRLDDVTAEFFRELETYILHLLEKHEPTILGLSVCIAMLPASLFAFKLAKERNPQIKTVMGGGIFADDLALKSENLQYFLEKIPYIDTLMVGEGELLMLKYLRGELPPSQKLYSLKDAGHGPLDLSTVDVPDFKDFKVDFYPYLSASASVGCLFNCRFCTIPEQWGKYRKKTARQVVQELTRLYDIYGRQLFLMVDSLLNPLMMDMAEEFIKSGTAIYWDGSLKISKEVCNTDNTLLWRRGGFYRAHIGVETGSQRLLNLMDKRITVDEIKNGIAGLAYAGIKTTTFWVVGYPGETEDDFRQTLELVEELKDDIFETTVRPYLYYEMKQVNPPRTSHKKGIPLYPEETVDKLLVKTWIQDCEPSREETIDRLNRFNKHIQRLGIPNPYTLFQLKEADERWQTLHENSVPALLEFQNRGAYIDECKNVRKVYYLPQTLDDDDGDFGI